MSRRVALAPIGAVIVGGLLLGGLLAAWLLAGGLVTASFASATDERGADLLTRAREAAAGYDFSGEVAVVWRADGRVHRERVPVRESRGVLKVGGDHSILSSGGDRLTARGGEWERLWGQPSGSDSEGLAVVDPERKYLLTVTEGPRVAGRPTTLIEAGRSGRVSERFAIDDETGLLLRREQLDRRGRVERAVGFVELSDPTPSVGTARMDTPRGEGSAPKVVTKSPPDYIAPLRLGHGFALTGRYLDTDGSVQLFYSDGIYAASLFEQVGELDPHDLPDDATSSDLAGDRVTTYATPSATVVVWADDDRVYTLVSDAPTRDLAAIMKDLPAPTRPDAASEMVEFILEPFRW